MIGRHQRRWRYMTRYIHLLHQLRRRWSCDPQECLLWWAGRPKALLASLQQFPVTKCLVSSDRKNHVSECLHYDIYNARANWSESNFRSVNNELHGYYKIRTWMSSSNTRCVLLYFASSLNALWLAKSSNYWHMHTKPAQYEENAWISLQHLCFI